MDRTLYAAEADTDDQVNGVGGTDGGDTDAEFNDDTVGDSDDAGDEGHDDADDGVGGTDQDAASRRNAIQDRAESERLIAERARLEGERAERDRIAREQAARDTREAERQEQELLATMSDQDKAQYLLAKETRNNKQTIQQTQMLLQSSTDQHKFSRTLTRKPQFAKYEDEVERRHQATLAQGGFISRDVILAHLIGEKALKGETNEAQRQEGKRRIQNQRQGARTARGDTTGRNSSGKSLVQRAEDQNWAI